MPGELHNENLQRGDTSKKGPQRPHFFEDFCVETQAGCVFGAVELQPVVFSQQLDQVIVALGGLLNVRMRLLNVRIRLLNVRIRVAVRRAALKNHMG